MRNQKKIQIPRHITNPEYTRNQDTPGEGKPYLYPHDFGGYVEQQYLPDNLVGTHFYQPSSNGYEPKIASFLEEVETKLKIRNKNAGR